MAYSADTFVADEQPTTAKWNKLWSNDASFNDGTGVGDNAIGSRQIQFANNADLYALNSGGSEKSLMRLDNDDYLRLGQLPYQADTTNSTREDVLIQHGWGFIVGDGVNAYISETVTFPAAYASAPLVLTQSIGWRSTGTTPTTPADFTSSHGTAGAEFTMVSAITTTNFALLIRLYTTIPTNQQQGYAWTAIGTKA